MYRGPSRGSIYPTLLGFGGIQDIILSIRYTALLRVREKKFYGVKVISGAGAVKFAERENPHRN